MNARARFEEQLDVARDALEVHLSIAHPTRRSYHDRLGDVDFLLSRVPPGRVHDELLARRHELVEAYIDALQSTLPRPAGPTPGFPNEVPHAA